MDRTGWIGVVTCSLLLMAYFSYVNTRYPSTVKSTVTAPSAPASEAPAPAASPEPLKIQSLQQKSFAPINNNEPESVLMLENKLVKVDVTSWGGGIKKITLKEHVGRESDPVFLNDGAEVAILARQGWDGPGQTGVYRLESKNDTIIASRILSNGVRVERTFQLKDNYQISVSEKISNPSPQAQILPEYFLNIGTSAPIHALDQSLYIGSSWMRRDSESWEKNNIHAFDAGGFLGFQWSAAREFIQQDLTPLRWMAVSNQFFVSLVSFPPELSTVQAEFHKVLLPSLSEKSSVIPAGIQSSVRFSGITLEPQAEKSFVYTLYGGPKEYPLLKALGNHQEQIMDFGMWGFIVKPLLNLMRWLYSWIPSYGWVIIVLTIIIKLALWPFQSAANKNMKQMQALAPRLQELQKKHENDQQKLSTEMMKLYKDYGVNPVGGCLPMLFQIPIFIALYTLLQSSVELRNHSFWWIRDLAQPDTVAHIPWLGIPVNPLPLIMTATSVLLMRMTPTSGNNPQMKMLQWMPLLFLFMLYSFAAALSLYWTVNNIISMFQTYINLRAPVPKLAKVKKPKLPGFGK